MNDDEMVSATAAALVYAASIVCALVGALYVRHGRRRRFSPMTADRARARARGKACLAWACALLGIAIVWTVQR